MRRWADGVSHITNIEYSQDIRATLGAAAQLGAKIQEEPHSLTITGRGNASGFVTVTRPVFCNESGSTLRFMIPLFSLTAQKIHFTGRGRLFDRPQAVYQMLFDRQGLRFEQSPDGITIFGRLRPGGFTLPGDVSSQFISGLLFAAPLMESESTIEVLAPYESRSYVDLTIGAMQQFGIKVASRARKKRQRALPHPRPPAVHRQRLFRGGRLQPGGLSGRAGLRDRRHHRDGPQPRQPTG